MIAQFINEYGTQILYAILIAVAGWLGTQFKAIYQKYVNDKTKRSVAQTVVKATEQLYHDLGGEEKLQKATESISAMLVEKGITVTDLEIRMLIESAVSEFNYGFGGEATLSLDTSAVASATASTATASPAVATTTNSDKESNTNE